MDHRMTNFVRAGFIRFQLFRVQRAMNYTKLALLMGLYDSAFTITRVYDQVLVEYPQGEMAAGVWRHLCSRRNYEQSLIKASCIINLALRYIHAVIARSFTGRENSQGVVKR